jgi:hypothetical protein
VCLISLWGRRLNSLYINFQKKSKIMGKCHGLESNKSLGITLNISYFKWCIREKRTNVFNVRTKEISAYFIMLEIYANPLFVISVLYKHTCGVCLVFYTTPPPLSLSLSLSPWTPVTALMKMKVGDSSKMLVASKYYQMML